MLIFKFIFNIVIYVFSLLIPKSRKYVVIGGWQGKRYADNSRGMYEYLYDNKNKLGIKKVFWYTRDKRIYEQLIQKGKDVLYGYTIRSIYWHLRSKIHMIDQNTRDILDIFSIRCIRVNLWHGIPLKKIGNYLFENNSYKWYLKYTSAGFWADQYILAPSEYSGELLSYAMGVKKEKCLIASYPRNEKLYQCNISIKEKEDVFHAFYLPTFRDKNDVNPLLTMDMAALNDKLKGANIILYIKPHFASILSWNKKEAFSNIHIFNATEDVYDWLYKTDLLITDYSSVYFDFMITLRAILFFPYDIEYYRNNDRGFIIPYEEYTPGDKVYTAEDFIKTLLYIRKHYAIYIKKYEKDYHHVNVKVNKYMDKPNYTDILKLWTR